jgi:hypothetical protein
VKAVRVSPRYVFEPFVGQCQVEGCDRQAMSSTMWICRRHYQSGWRERHPGYQAAWKAANPAKVAEYRATYNAKRRAARARAREE